MDYKEKLCSFFGNNESPPDEPNTFYACFEQKVHITHPIGLSCNSTNSYCGRHKVSFPESESAENNWPGWSPQPHLWNQLAEVFMDIVKLSLQFDITNSFKKTTIVPMPKKS